MITPLPDTNKSVIIVINEFVKLILLLRKRIFLLIMNNNFYFCYTGDHVPHMIQISDNSTWETLCEAVCDAAGLKSVSYVELYDRNSESVVGERILDIDDFWSSSQYYQDQMIFVVFGVSNSDHTPERHNLQETSEAQCTSLTSEHHVNTSTNSLDTDQNDSHSSSWGKHGKMHGGEEGSSDSDNKNFDVNTYVDMSKYLKPSESQEEYDHNSAESDFSSSLASLMSGLNQLNASTPSTLTLNRSIINSATSEERSSSMASMKTSAELEMERLQEEEEKRRLAAEEEARRIKIEEEARKMRELLENERAERDRLDMEERRAKEAALLEEKRKKDEEERIRKEEAEVLLMAEKKRQRTEAIAKQRLLAQEERRRELQMKREKEAEERAEEKSRGKGKSKGSVSLPPAARDKELEGDAKTISSLGSSISNFDKGVDDNDTEDDDDDAIWSRSAEHNARKRAHQMEKIKRVDSLSSHRRSDYSGDTSLDDKKVPVMGNSRLRAIKKPTQKCLKTYFKSIFSDDKSDNGGLICVEVGEDCDWIDLTSTVSVILELSSYDEIKHFILLDEDGEETSGVISDARKFWKYHKRRYDFENKMSFLVFHSLKPEPKLFNEDIPIKNKRNKDGKGAATGRKDSTASKPMPSYASFRLSSDYVDDRTKIKLPPFVNSWDKLAALLADQFGILPTSSIGRMALFDEDGDELSSINSFENFSKVLRGRYDPDVHVFVVDFETTTDAAKPPTSHAPATTSTTDLSIFCRIENMQSDRINVMVPRDGSWERVCNVLLKAFRINIGFTITSIRLIDEEGDELFSGISSERQFWKAVSNRYHGDAMTFLLNVCKSDELEVGYAIPLFFNLPEGDGGARKELDISRDITWEGLCLKLIDFYGYSRKSNVKRIDLIDDDGDVVFGAITNEKKFWKAVKNRYNSEDMVFIARIEGNREDNISSNIPVTRLNFRLSSDSLDRGDAVSIPIGGDWEDIISAILEYYDFDVPCIVSRIDLVDEDGDDVLGSITDGKKFWKAVNNRYNSVDMTFVVTVEAKDAPRIVLNSPSTSLNFRLSTDSPTRIDTIDIPIDSNWDDVTSAVLAFYNFDIPCSVTRLDLVDEDGDDVLGSIVNQKKFWKAVNNRYNGAEMVFVVSVEAIANHEPDMSMAEMPRVPCTSLNFRLSTDTPDRKDSIDIPIDGNWDDVTSAILAFYNFDIPCSVTRLDLVDEDGDDVLGSIVNQKKFWKAVNNRYNGAEMVFVVSVEAIANHEPDMSMAEMPRVPCTSLNFRLSTDTPDRKDSIDIPIDGNWDDVTSAVLAFYNFDIPCSITRLDLVDEDGDDVLGSIVNQKKFWKAVNNRYNGAEMVFVVSVEAIANHEPDMSMAEMPRVPCTSLNFRLSTDTPDRKDSIDIPIDGNWDDVTSAILAFYNFDIPCSVTRLDLVDEDGDDVLGSIVNQKKFWKAVNNRYNGAEMVFVITVENVRYNDSLSETATTLEMESVNSKLSLNVDDPPKSGARWASRRGDVSSEKKGNRDASSVKDFEGRVVQISFKLPLEPISKAVPTNIPAMGEWDKVCDGIRETFEFSRNTVIDHVELIDEDGDTVQSTVKSTEKFWKACIDLYKEGFSVFNVYVGKSRRKSDSAQEPWKRVDERDRGSRKHLLTNDSIDKSDHTNTSNLSSSGHNAAGSVVSTSDFLRSCCSGDLEFVSNALHKGYDINSKDDVGLTGLHVACIQGQSKVVELLLDKGAQISCRDVDGMTPLHFACENNHVQIAISLTRGGADTSLRNKVGLTALHYICMNGLMPLTVLIRDYMINVATSAGLTLLHCAADMGHFDMVQYLVEHDALIMPRDDDGMTPLHLACLGGHNDCVEYLIDNGSYWNARDDEGMSPLLMAVKEGNVELVEILQDHGANVHARNDLGNTAMHLACEIGSMDMSKFLLDVKVDINSRNKGMETPLIIAMKCGHDNLASWLQDRGATIESLSREEAEVIHQIDTKGEAAARAFESEEEMNLEHERNAKRSRNSGNKW